MAARPPALEVSVWSDVACPWCWVGLKRYQRAVARVADRAAVKTRFHAYIIDNKTKPDGEEYLAYNRRRWGSDAWTQGLRASGKPDGAAFADWRWWPNTLKAHQLIALAEEQGIEGEAAKQALFEATYERGLNVSATAVLEQVAGELGVEGAGEALALNRLAEAVLQADAHAKEALSINGVPQFVIGSGSKRTVLHGAQSADAFEQALQREIARLAPVAH